MTPEYNKIITTGHAGFALRHTWLKKAHDLGVGAFSKDDATIKLGVGKNMVQSIRFYAEHCDIFNSAESEKGKYDLNFADIFADGGCDPYLDYGETIWLIHHKLAVNHRLASYYEFFNSFNDTIFSNARYKEFLQSRLKERKIEKMPAEETLKRDVECLMSNYAVKTEEKPTDSFGALLRELNLIKTVERGVHKRIYQKNSNVSDSIFLYVLGYFWRIKHAGNRTLSLQAISQDPESPGRIFQMHEDEVQKKLRDISNKKSNPVTISETAGIINMVAETDSRHLAEYSAKELFKIYGTI